MRRMTREKNNRQTASPFTEQLATLIPSLLPLAEALEEAAASDLPVLFIGAAGTGKTYLARLLHQFSPRSEHPFVIMPCGSLAPNSLPSVLFGQVQDAPEGVDVFCAGRLATAGLGGLLLKDIDTLSLQVQSALLRFIQTGTYEPVGSVELHFSQTRIFAATNSDLKKDVIKKRFRGDLYHCFHNFTFYLPPLCQRQEDIEPLAQAMVIRSADQFHKKPPRLLPETLRVLQSFSWPGNIRQLETSIQHAVLICSRDELHVEHLPQNLREAAGDQST